MWKAPDETMPAIQDGKPFQFSCAHDVEGILEHIIVMTGGSKYS